MDVQQALTSLKKNGYGVIENFCKPEECDILMAEMRRLVKQANLDKLTEVPAAFDTADYSKHGRDEQLFDSAEDIQFFWEVGVRDAQGKLMFPVENALHKVGHALHLKNDVFKNFVFSDRVRAIFKSLGWIRPQAFQSMYIFKQPKIGGAATPHVDSTFQHVAGDPGEGLLGMWVALEDATPENGCLEFVPGSQVDGCNRRWVREGEPACMVMEGVDKIYPDESYVKVPVKRGSMVLLNGNVMHRSGKNISENSRNIFTWHSFEGGKPGIKWDERNWQQYTGGNEAIPNVYV